MDHFVGVITYARDTVDVITPILNLEDNMKKMKESMSKLRSTAIQKDKEATAGSILRGRDVNEEFKNLLEAACKLFDEVHLLKAEYENFQNMASQAPLGKLLSLPSSLWTKHRMSRRALALVEKMDDQRKELRGDEESRGINMFGDIPAARGRRGKVMEMQVHELWNWSTGVGKGKLVCVHGMGGVGKTRLFEELYEKFMEECQNIRVIMIKVREQMEWRRIQRDIARKLMLGWENKEEEVLASRISDTLEDNGEYVFLFDEVWEELPLSSIGIRCYENSTTTRHKTIPRSCMVVFSTRISTLCRGADYTIPLQCLPEKESWSLFLETTGRSSSELIETTPEIKSLAMQIVEECEGLPLALVNAGQAFSGVSGVADWEKGVRDMKREPWNVNRMAGNVLEILRRSYDNLTSDRLKLCFTYFAIRPKIGTEDDNLWLLRLTDYWIGERVIEHWTNIDDADARRDQLIEELKDAGLVSPGHPPRLHKMVRAMAVWLGCVGERYIAMSEMGLTNAEPEGAMNWKDATRISLLDNKIICWPEEPNCPNLLTLLIWQNAPNRALPDGFFRRMCSLKVLHLCALEELPSSIGELHLLEFLHLGFSNIKSLPVEIGKLVMLRYLSLSYSKNLEVVPCGIFGKLTKLEFLGLYDTYSKWGVDADGAKIEELYGLEHLKYLTITIDNIAALKALLLSSHLQSVTVYIKLKQLNGKQSIHLSGELGMDLKQLKDLAIWQCVDLEEIVCGVSNRATSSMENLDLMDVRHLHKAKVMFRGVGARDNNDQCFMRNLKRLQIINCNKLVELVKDGCEVFLTFPSLRELWLEHLPAMKNEEKRKRRGTKKRREEDDGGRWCRVFGGLIAGRASQARPAFMEFTTARRPGLANPASAFRQRTGFGNPGLLPKCDAGVSKPGLDHSMVNFEGPTIYW